MARKQRKFRQKIIAVDLDGVILHYRKGMMRKGIFGKAIFGAKEHLKKLIEDGWYVIIYTVRGDREKIKNALSRYGIVKGEHYSAINRRKNVVPGSYRGKCGADIYVCDRTITFTGDWGKTYKKIKNFVPWEGKKSAGI